MKNKFFNNTFWIGIIILIILSTIKVFFQISKNNSKRENIEEQIAIINKKIENTKIQIERYDERIQALDNSFEKEKLARNILKMTKKDEVIYKFVDKENKKDSEGEK